MWNAFLKTVIGGKTNSINWTILLQYSSSWVSMHKEEWWRNQRTSWHRRQLTFILLIASHSVHFLFTTIRHSRLTTIHLEFTYHALANCILLATHFAWAQLATVTLRDGDKTGHWKRGSLVAPPNPKRKKNGGSDECVSKLLKYSSQVCLTM